MQIEYFDHGMALGIGVLLIDFLAWRFLAFQDTRRRLFVRVVLFAILNYALWSLELSPFRAAPSFGDPARHFLAQGLELLWWPQATQVSTALISTVLLPPGLHQARLFQDVLRALVFLLASFAGITYVLALPIGGLLATSGALAIIFGLAVQSTLADVFSGVVLNATQPFRFGDNVAIGDVQGQVVESNWRATTLLDSHGNYVVVPNSSAAKSTIVNQSRPPRMHGMTVPIRLSPIYPPAMILEALSDAIASTPNIIDLPKPSVSATSMHRNFIEYEILLYVASPSDKASVRNKMIGQIHRHLAAHGVDFNVRYIKGPQQDDIGKLLRGIDMFQSLDDDQLNELARSIVRKQYSKGQTIYEVDASSSDEHRALYILTSGVATLFTTRDAREVELRRMIPGDSVGIASVLTGISISIKLVALRSVSIAILHKDAITPILQRNPEVEEAMLGSLMMFQAREAEVLKEIPSHIDEKGDIFRRLLSSMRRLHGLMH